MLLVTMGCGEVAPDVPGLQFLDWPLVDPKGKTIEEVRVHALRNLPPATVDHQARPRFSLTTVVPPIGHACRRECILREKQSYNAESDCHPPASARAQY